MYVVHAAGTHVCLKLRIPVDQSGVHLLHDFQQLQKNMVSHLREKNIGKFQLNVFQTSFVARHFLLCAFAVGGFGCYIKQHAHCCKSSSPGCCSEHL